MSVVSAILSRRVLEEPHAAKKRRNGGLKEAPKEEGEGAENPPKKRQGPLSTVGARSVRPRPLSGTRPEDRFSLRESRFFPFPTGTERELPSGRIKRHVFRGCTNSRRSQSTSSRDSSILVNTANFSAERFWVTLERILLLEDKIVVNVGKNGQCN